MQQAIPVSELDGAKWWDVVQGHNLPARFVRGWADKVPRGHFLPIQYEAIPSDIRKTHWKIAQRKKQEDPGVMMQPSVCCVAKFSEDADDLSIVIGHGTQ